MTVTASHEMVERVSEAISEACEYALPPLLLDRCARAAIEAMREPTLEMISSGERAATARESQFTNVPVKLMMCKTSWQAMIDAALK